MRDRSIPRSGTYRRLRPAPNLLEHPDTYEWYYENYYTLRTRIEALAMEIEDEDEGDNDSYAQERMKIARRLRALLKEGSP